VVTLQSVTEKPIDLIKLRSLLREFRGRAAIGRDPKLLGLKYSFFFRAEGEEEVEIGIDETSFNGKPGTGHPKPGVYRVEGMNKDTGEVLLNRTGLWLETKDPSASDEEKAKDPAVAGMSAVIRGTQALSEMSTYEIDRIFKRMQSRDEQIDELEAKLKETIDGINDLKTENRRLTIERDEADQRAAWAEKREQDRIEEFEAYKERGGELAPFAGKAAKAAVDRVVLLFGGSQEVFNAKREDAKNEIVTAVATNVVMLMDLVRMGVVEWENARWAMWAVFDEDPGEEVNFDWRPTSAEPPPPETPEAPPDAEAVH